jgi:hypothetical protein
VTIADNALAVMFANPVMAKDATWFAGGVGQGVSVRVAEKSPDVVTDYGAGRIWSETQTVDILVSSAPTLAPGDLIAFGGTTYSVQGEPRRDRDQLIWTAELVPA